MPRPSSLASPGLSEWLNASNCITFRCGGTGGGGGGNHNTHTTKGWIARDAVGELGKKWQASAKGEGEGGRSKRGGEAKEDRHGRGDRGRFKG
jgi:hypothetical protein